MLGGSRLGYGHLSPRKSQVAIGFLTNTGTKHPQTDEALEEEGATNNVRTLSVTHTHTHTHTRAHPHATDEKSAHFMQCVSNSFDHTHSDLSDLNST